MGAILAWSMGWEIRSSTTVCAWIPDERRLDPSRSSKETQGMLQNLRKGLSPGVGAPPPELPGHNLLTALCRYPLDAANEKRLFGQSKYHNGLVSPASKSLCKLPDECCPQETNSTHAGITADGRKSALSVDPLDTFPSDKLRYPGDNSPIAGVSGTQNVKVEP
jgi:hypothetical protein